MKISWKYTSVCCGVTFSSSIASIILAMTWNIDFYAPPPPLSPHHINMGVFVLQESADMVRSFVGGLQLITNLLRSDDKQVIISRVKPMYAFFLRARLLESWIRLSVKEMKRCLNTKWTSTFALRGKRLKNKKWDRLSSIVSLVFEIRKPERVQCGAVYSDIVIVVCDTWKRSVYCCKTNVFLH